MAFDGLKNISDKIAPSIFAGDFSNLKNEIKKAKRRIKSLQKKLSELGPVMRGSVVLIGTKNKQTYFSLNKNKKTKRKEGFFF